MQVTINNGSRGNDCCDWSLADLKTRTPSRSNFFSQKSRQIMRVGVLPRLRISGPATDCVNGWYLKWLNFELYYWPRSGVSNVFTSVRHFVHRGYVSQHGLGQWGEYPSMNLGKECLPRKFLPKGYVWAATPSQTHPTPPPLPRDGHCRGRYAFYWNAFFLIFRLTLLVEPT